MNEVGINKSEFLVKEKFTISWIKPCVFKVDVHENAYLELEDIEEIQLYKAALTQNKPYGVLFITPNFGNISKEAKDFLASEAGCKNAIAKAVVVSNLGVKIIYNYFIQFNKPVVIHKAFSNEKAALSWLLKYVNLPN